MEVLAETDERFECGRLGSPAAQNEHTHNRAADHRMKSHWTQLVPHTTDGLAKSTQSALRWQYLGNFTRLVLGLGINILLTRLLGPAPFGQLAAAMIVYGFASLLSNAGLSSALIQKKNLTAEDIRFCCTAQMLIALCLSAFLYASAFQWARFFHDPSTSSILHVLSVVFVLQAFGTTSTALLNRSLKTKVVQTCSILSYAVAYLFLGIPLALAGFGVWSLVTAQITQSLLYSVLAYSRVRHPVLPLLDRSHAGMLGFGYRVLLANMSSWGISNLDNTVVGRVSGSVALGLYNRAFTLAALPAEAVISGLLQVLLPSLSRVQGDTAKVARVYSALVGAVCMVLCPVFFAMAVVPEVVVLGLYGEKWAGAVALFQPLAIAIPLNALLALAGPVLSARGKPQLELRGQAIAVFVAGIVYTVAVHKSVLALSWSVPAVYLLRLWLLSGMALKEVRGSWRDLMSTVWPGLFLAIISASIVRVTSSLLPPMGYALRLVIVAASGAASVALCLLLRSTWLLRPILLNAPQFAEMFPGVFRRLLPCEWRA